MGFSNSVKNNAVPEWRDFYIDYDKLRSKLKKKGFKTMIFEELAKINNFYFLLERRAVEEKNKLFDDVFTELPDENHEDLRAQTEDPNSEESAEYYNTEDLSEPERVERVERKRGNRMGFKTEATVKLKDSTTSYGTEGGVEDENASENSSALTDVLQERIGQGLKRFMRMPRGITRRKKEKAITEFLHTLVKITTYKDLNSSAIVKLAKKHAAIKKDQAFLKEFERRHHSMYFYKSRKIEQIRAAIKKLYKRLFAKNQPEKAKRVFKRIKKGLKSSDWLIIISGILIGVSYTFALTSFNPYLLKHRTFWAINNWYFGFIIFGLSIKIFKNLNINYKFIFNFDVCSTMNNSLYLTTLSVMLFLNVSLYSIIQYTEPQLYIVAIILQILVLFIPFDFLFYNSRLYLISTFARILFQPLSTVRFRHFYFADVAQSFSFPICQLFFAFGVKNPLIPVIFCMLFPIIRIMQCLKRYTNSKLLFPHVVNCGKFTLSLLFSLSRLIESKNHDFFGFLVFFGICSTFASLLWDIFVDWAILRSQRIYPFAVYLFLIGYNSIVRFSWTTKFVFNKDFPVFESICEILRRFLWTLLRVEVEHLNNCDEFKMKNAVSLAAGELFYKKDQVEIYRAKGYKNETETEDNSDGTNATKEIVV